ncbi:hypothetical protein HDZ31DRAFT_34347 [Schizophyllum fasciatum]
MSTASPDRNIRSTPFFITFPIRIELAKQRGEDKPTIPPNFLRSTAYKAVLNALSKPVIPRTTTPYSAEEWLIVLKAFDALFCALHIFDATDSCPSSRTRSKLAGDLIPVMWDWLRFFVADSKTQHPRGEDLLAAAKRHNWLIFAGENSEKTCINILATLVCRAVRRCSEESIAVLVTVPKMAQVLYDLYDAATRMPCQIEGTDTVTSVLSSLAMVCNHPQHGKQACKLFADELAARGRSEGRVLARRLRSLLRAPDPSFHNIYMIFLFVRGICNDTSAPALRPLLWLIGEALCFLEHPNAHKHTTAWDADAPLEICRDLYAASCILLLTNLRSQVCGTADVIRLFKTGLLRGIYQALRTFPASANTSIYASDMVNNLIKPTLIFPSVMKAVAQALVRDSLELHVPGLPPRDKWNELGALIRERMAVVARVRQEVKQAQFCHNGQCPKERTANFKLRRCPCGDAYYCSKTCQAAHRPQHRASCQEGARPIMNFFEPPLDPECSSARHFDWYFIRRCAREDARRLPVIRLGGSDYIGVDYSMWTDEFVYGKEHGRAPSNNGSKVCVRAFTAVGIRVTAVDCGELTR